jgi:GNAT superfamily N-acetyltransferase
MSPDPLAVTVEPALPGSAEGRLVLAAYFRDIVGRYHGREATRREVDDAMDAEPSDDLCLPGGLFFVARHAGAVVGCAGLRLLALGLGEVTRVFVMPGSRRRGVGQLLLDAVEAAAREQRLTRLRLDTGSHLTEAQRLYVKNGYLEVPPFSDYRMSDHWYEKPLA